MRLAIDTLAIDRSETWAVGTQVAGAAWDWREARGKLVAGTLEPHDVAGCTRKLACIPRNPRVVDLTCGVTSSLHR